MKESLSFGELLAFRFYGWWQFGLCQNAITLTILRKERGIKMIIVIILVVLVLVTLASSSQIQSEKNVPHDMPVNNEIDATAKKAESEQERR